MRLVLACLLLMRAAPVWAATQDLSMSATSTPDNWTLGAGATKQAAVAAPDDDATSYIHSTTHGFLAEQSIRLDRFSERLERVDRRLEIADS